MQNLRAVIPYGKLSYPYYSIGKRGANSSASGCRPSRSACVNLPWLDGGNLGFRWPDASGIMMGVLAAALGVLARVLPGKHVLTGKKAALLLLGLALAALTALFVIPVPEDAGGLWYPVNRTFCQPGNTVYRP